MLIRHQNGREVSKLCRGLADSLQTPLGGVVCPWVGLKRKARSIPAVYAKIASALSIMSSTRRAGLSEGNGVIPVDFVLHSFPLHWLFDHVHFGPSSRLSCRL